MRRQTSPLLAPVFCRIVDSMREKEPFARPGILYPIRVELGDGVDECSPYQLQEKVDELLSSSKKFATTKMGKVYNRNQSEARTIKAYRQYVMTGSMRGGYVKGDHRYGPRVTGYGGATTKPGLRWNGEDL